ncbi:hypothetical protein GCM10022631_12590 [Deinococcus rubellus]
MRNELSVNSKQVGHRGSIHNCRPVIFISEGTEQEVSEEEPILRGTDLELRAEGFSEGFGDKDIQTLRGKG